MQDISALITKNFQDNVEFFQKNYPEIFNLIASLDSALDSGNYIQRYELVYEDGGFDIYEKSTGIFLYNKQSNKHKDSVLKESFYSFESFVNHKNIDYKSKDDFQSSLDGVVNVLNSIENDLKYMDKFIFFGTGLGLHIDAVLKSNNIKSCLIIEDDLELFRNSLFTINYKELAKDKKLFFNIFDMDISKTFQEFLEYEYHYNHYIYYYHLASHSDDKIDKFYNALISQPHITYRYNKLLWHYINGIKYIILSFYI